LDGLQVTKEKDSSALELKRAMQLKTEEIIASLEGVYLQIDADPDRLVMPSQISVQEQALDVC
jgi:hypothetical protein